MDKIEQTAMELKRRYQTNNPFAICDMLDIPVLFVALPQSVKGFFTFIQGTNIVYINDSMSRSCISAKVVCAHELGHVLLHEQLNSFFLSAATLQVKSRYEREADYFSVCLLLEDGRTMYDRYGLCTTEQIACFFGIDERLVKMRYQD